MVGGAGQSLKLSSGDLSTIGPVAGRGSETSGSLMRVSDPPSQTTRSHAESCHLRLEPASGALPPPAQVSSPPHPHSPGPAPASPHRTPPVLTPRAATFEVGSTSTAHSHTRRTPAPEAAGLRCPSLPRKPPVLTPKVGGAARLSVDAPRCMFPRFFRGSYGSSAHE